MEQEDMARPDGTGSHPSDQAPEGLGGARFDPSRVIDYINAANVEGVIAEYVARYEQDGWATPETWDRFKRTMNAKIGINRTDGMQVILKHVHVNWSKYPGCGDDEEHIDVGGRDASHSNWSLSFTPWGEWKLMQVEDASGLALSVDQVAAHLFYEICWYGWEDAAVERHAELMDRVEEVERGLVGVVPFIPSDSGRHPEGENGEAG